MQINSAAPSAQAAQGVTLSDGLVINDKTFDAHIARMTAQSQAAGPTAGALWFTAQNQRS